MVSLEKSASGQHAKEVPQFPVHVFRPRHSLGDFFPQSFPILLAQARDRHLHGAFGHPQFRRQRGIWLGFAAPNETRLERVEQGCFGWLCMLLAQVA